MSANRADEPPMYACPSCGARARLTWLHNDGTPAPPTCVGCGRAYMIEEN